MKHIINPIILMTLSFGAVFSVDFNGNGMDLARVIKSTSGQFCVLDDPTIGLEEVAISRKGAGFPGLLRDIMRDTLLSIGMKNGSLCLRRRSDQKNIPRVYSSEETALVVERSDGIDEISVLTSRLFYPNGFTVGFLRGEKREKIMAKMRRKDGQERFRIDEFPQIALSEGVFVVEAENAFARQEIARVPIVAGTYKTRLGEVSVAIEPSDSDAIGGRQGLFTAKVSLSPSNDNVDYAILEVSAYDAAGAIITSQSITSASGKRPTAELSAMSTIPANGVISIIMAGDRQRRLELEIKQTEQ